MDNNGIKQLLRPYRKKIDRLDDRILRLLGDRFRVIRSVARLKAKHGIPPVLPERVVEVFERTAAQAKKHEIDPSLVRILYALIVHHSCETERHAARKTPKK